MVLAFKGFCSWQLTNECKDSAPNIVSIEYIVQSFFFHWLEVIGMDNGAVSYFFLDYWTNQAWKSKERIEIKMNKKRICGVYQGHKLPLAVEDYTGRRLHLFFFFPCSNLMDSCKIHRAQYYVGRLSVQFCTATDCPLRNFLHY